MQFFSLLNLSDACHFNAASQVQKLSFDDQITCFEKTKAAITLKIGEKASEKLCNEAVYFIGLGMAISTSYIITSMSYILKHKCNVFFKFSSPFAGSNDYVNNFMQPFLVDAQLYTNHEFLELLILTLNGQLRVISNLPTHCTKTRQLS